MTKMHLGGPPLYEVEQHYYFPVPIDTVQRYEEYSSTECMTHPPSNIFYEESNTLQELSCILVSLKLSEINVFQQKM